MNPKLKCAKIFSQVWVSLGSESIIVKDSVKNHSESLQHCEAYKLQQKGDVGVNVYMESVFLNSPLGKSYLQLREDKMASTLSLGLFTIT